MNREMAMASKIMKTIFERKLKNFAMIFAKDAKSIFMNGEGVLIHPGEYGKYREEICKELLKLMLNTNLDVSDGFVVTSEDSISNQCDIIVYNKEIAPIISGDIAKMYPVEEVRMIGEVKSSMTKKQYVAALRKLARNKEKLINDRLDYSHEKSKKPDYCDTIGTFLICSKLNLKLEELKNEEIYKGIDRKYWHNAILSVEDAYITYSMDASNANREDIEKLKSAGYDLSKKPVFFYPHFSVTRGRLVENSERHIHCDKNNKYAHIEKFFVSISNCATEVCKYEYDNVAYLGLDDKELFKEQKD